MDFASLSVGTRVLYIAMLVIVAYFGLANALIQLVNYGRFYRPFGQKMAQWDIYKDKNYANLMRGRLLGNLVVFGLSGALTVLMCMRTQGIGIATAGLSFAAGVLLYSKNLRYELWNVQQFVRKYGEYLDKEKFARFLRREYDISLDKLNDRDFILRRSAKK